MGKSMFGIPMVPRVVSGGCGEVTATRTIRYSRNSKNRKCDGIFGGHDEALNADVEEKQIAVDPGEQDGFFRISHSETMIAHCSTVCAKLSKCRMKLQKGTKRILFSQ